MQIRIKALTETGEKCLRKVKPDNGQIRRQKLYDKPLTYLFEFKGFALRLKATEDDVKKIFPLLLRPAIEGEDYIMETE